MNNDIKAFFTSQSEELAARAKRVRRLIGDAHWYTDGALKEALVVEFLRQRLPAGMEARRGFVLSRDLSDRSREQDCVIFDRQVSAPVFEAVDFQMVNPQGVCGLISVKTKLQKTEFLDAAQGIVSALKIVAQDSLAGNPFLSIFFFDEDPRAKDDTVVGWVAEFVKGEGWPLRRRDPIGGDQILGPLLAFTLNDRCFRIDYSQIDQRTSVRLYTTPANISAAVFLHQAETSCLNCRKPGATTAWEVLDDSSIATLTSNVCL